MNNVSRPLGGLDLNQLVTLQVLLSTSSVSESARALNVSQPSVSRSLAQLREVFRDPLLIRTGKGMALTTVAQELSSRLDHALGMVARLYRPGEFNVRTDGRVFRLVLPDILALGVLTNLYERFELAENARLEILGYEGSAETMLLTGRVDLVVGAARLTHPDLF